VTLLLYILRFRIGARQHEVSKLYGTLALSAGTLMASGGSLYRLLPIHFYPWLSTKSTLIVSVGNSYSVFVCVRTCVICVDSDAVTSPTQPAAKPTTMISTAVGGDEQPVPDHAELRLLRRELSELRETVDQLRAQFDRRVRQLQAEVDEEKESRRQLVADVERLKKTVTNRRQRPF